MKTTDKLRFLAGIGALTIATTWPAIATTESITAEELMDRLSTKEFADRIKKLSIRIGAEPQGMTITRDMSAYRLVTVVCGTGSKAAYKISTRVLQTHENITLDMSKKKNCIQYKLAGSDLNGKVMAAAASLYLVSAFELESNSVVEVKQ